MDEEYDLDAKENFDQSRKVREWIYSCLKPEDIDLDLDDNETFVTLSGQLIFHENIWPSLKKLKLIRDKKSSFNSEQSTFSGISSIESLLDLRREDSEDVLYALGLVDFDEDDRIKRIPKRFFQKKSQAKGIDVEDFIKSFEERSEDGFNILNNVSTPDHFRGKDLSLLKRFLIIPKTDQNNDCDENCGDLSEHELLRRYMATILNPNRNSILIPENLEHLKKQEPKFDHSNKRLVLGTKSYYFNDEGQAIVLPKSPASSQLDH